MKTEENLFCPMDKNIISPPFEWSIGKYLGLCTIFILKTSKINVTEINVWVYHAII